jgi:hypothetical protein
MAGGGVKLAMPCCQIKFRNAGIPRKSYLGIGISSGRQLPQSDIGIPALGFKPVPLVTD